MEDNLSISLYTNPVERQNQTSLFLARTVHKLNVRNQLKTQSTDVVIFQLTFLLDNLDFYPK